MVRENKINHRPGVAKENEVLITRTFDAPRALVFEAWSKLEHLLQWFAPHGATVEFYKFDFSEEGKFQHKIQCADGHSCLCKGVFHEIEPPHRIVYSIWFCDVEGKFVEADKISQHEGWPDVTTVTVLFDEFNGQTRLTLHQTVSEKVARKIGAYSGWLEMLEKLELIVSIEFGNSSLSHYHS